MIRHLRILEFALSTLLRQKTKNFLIVLIFCFVVFTLASLLFLTQALKHEAEGLLSHAPDMTVQRLSAGRHAWIPVSYATAIARFPGVKAVVPRLWGYYYDPPVGANYTFMGADALPAEVSNMIEGEFFKETDRFGCIVGRGIAEARLLDPDDILPIKGADGTLIVLRVKGIFRSDSQLLTNDLVVMSPENFRRIFSVPEDLATDLAVRIPNTREIDTVALKILERLPDTRPIGRDQILRTYAAVFDWRGGIMVAVLGGCLAAFVVFAWDRASGLSADERRTIGILKAVGWETSDVLELKFWEGFAVSVLAFITGTLAAHIHVFSFGCALFAPVLKGWSVLFPEFTLRPHAEALQILVLVFLTMVPYILATIIPSWKAAITDPDMIMRQ